MGARRTRGRVLSREMRDYYGRQCMSEAVRTDSSGSDDPLGSALLRPFPFRARLRLGPPSSSSRGRTPVAGGGGGVVLPGFISETS